MRLACAVLLFSHPVWARRAETVPVTWRPVHYDVRLTLDPDLSTLTAARTVVTIQQSRPNRSLELDFGKLPVRKVSVAAVPLAFEQTGEKLRVDLPPGMADRFSLAVEYSGTPEDGLIFGRDADGRPSVIGDNWPNRLHHWVPCVDHPSLKATVNFSVTAPRGVVVANGQLKLHAGDTWEFQQSVPIPPYCMIVAVGDFARGKPPGVVELSTYVAPSQAQWAPQGFSSANATVDFLQRQVGPFPYEKLALIVGTTRYGGMENASAIVFNPRIVTRTEEQRTSLVAHEISHQWFGDSVTPANWSELWLSEGFATYFAGLFLRERNGEDAFRRYMQRGATLYRDGVPGLPLHDPDTEPLVKLLNANAYQKGAWVLHMLRREVGERTFFAAVRSYFREHRDATATTEDLRRAFERTSGKNLEAFFRRWVYGPGHPIYQLRWSWREGTLLLRLRQLQSGDAFPDILTVQVQTAQATRKLLLEPFGKEFARSFPLAERPSSLLLDPDGELLMEADVVEDNQL